MEKVPKIVRERLLAATVSVAHPDADLLTAFSEHTLPERERGPILDHLARCSECREVVALALPAEDVAAVVIRPNRNQWLSWPRMRWAFVAAGVVAVASVGLVQLQFTSRHATVAKVFDAAPSVVTQEQHQPAPLPPISNAVSVETKKEAHALPSSGGSPAKARRDADQEFDRLQAFDKLKKSPGEKGSVTGGVVYGNTFHGQVLTHGPKAPVQFQQSSNWGLNRNNGLTDQASVPAPSPPTSNQQPSKELVLVPAPSPGSNSGGPLNDKQALDQVAVNGRSTPILFPSAGASTGAEIARAKPATAANAPQAAPATQAYAVTADGSNFSSSGSLVPETARWSINSVGGLQRSVDQGRTWQDVDVNIAAGKGNGMGLSMAMKSSRAKMTKDKADAKEKPILFRAVSANGPDVWAGGSEGNLYHSTDSGATWVRVVASWRGIDLTNDILNLQFSDPQHGRIVTSAAEIWTTADAGQTWEKH